MSVDTYRLMKPTHLHDDQLDFIAALRALPEPPPMRSEFWQALRKRIMAEAQKLEAERNSREDSDVQAQSSDRRCPRRHAAEHRASSSHRQSTD